MLPNQDKEEIISMHLFKGRKSKGKPRERQLNAPAKYFVPRTGKNLNRKKRSKNDP